VKRRAGGHAGPVLRGFSRRPVRSFTAFQPPQHPPRLAQLPIRQFTRANADDLDRLLSQLPIRQFTEISALYMPLGFSQLPIRQFTRPLLRQVFAWSGFFRRMPQCTLFFCR
jgi:hypothetical protein